MPIKLVKKQRNSNQTNQVVGTPKNSEIQIDTTNNISIDAESTFMFPAIKTKEQVFDWVLGNLGYPLVTVELTTQHLNLCLSDALSLYSKYAHFPERYLVMKLSEYNQPRMEPEKDENGNDKLDENNNPIYPSSLVYMNDRKGEYGLDLSPFNVAVVREITTSYGMFGGSDMFFNGYATINSMFDSSFGSFSPSSGCFTTFHNFHEWSDLLHRLGGSNPDFTYNKRTHRLTLYPAPPKNISDKALILMTVECEPDLEELFGNEYVRRIVLAKAKILLGQIRSKFQGVSLVGGGNVDSSIGQQGEQELSYILDNLRRDESKSNMFFIM